MEPLLEATSSLNPEVEIKTIFISLMDRLASFASGKDISEFAKDTNIFKLFKKYTDKIIEEQGRSIELSRLLELQVAFLNFSIKTDPNEPSVNAILESTAYLIKSNPNREEKLNKEAMKSLVLILTIPLKHFSLTVLKMSHFPTLMQYMAHDSKRTVSLKIVNAVIKSKKRLDAEPVVDQLVRFIEPLLTGDSEGVQAYEFEEE